MTTYIEDAINKKELLMKYPEIVTFKELSFNKKQEFLKFFKGNKNLLENMFSIVSEIQYVSPIKEYFNRLKEASNSELKIFLMYKGEKLIGVIDGFKDNPVKNRFYISHFAIKKEHQFKGHGRTLMARAYAILNKLGYSSIEMVGLKGTEQINLQLTGKKVFKNGKLRKFSGRTEYEYPHTDFIKINKISKSHAK